MHETNNEIHSWHIIGTNKTESYGHVLDGVEPLNYCRGSLHLDAVALRHFG